MARNDWRRCTGIIFVESYVWFRVHGFACLKKQHVPGRDDGTPRGRQGTREDIIGLAVTLSAVAKVGQRQWLIARKIRLTSRRIDGNAQKPGRRRVSHGCWWQRDNKETHVTRGNTAARWRS